MDTAEFQKVINEFNTASLDRKIDIYIGTEGLSQEQYRELLRMFPLNELQKLEEALA
jgi:hypothetical protein